MKQDEIMNLPGKNPLDFNFNDLFVLEEIQRLQDIFSEANGVASIITHPDGTPITKPSNFCRLCLNIIRKTEKGLAYCMKSDAALGHYNSTGPIVKPCLSGGLWDSGTSITVGGKHIANWLIGQVRNEGLNTQRMIQFAEEIGANIEDFMAALKEVPEMSIIQFNKISEMLFAFANELSEKAYKNMLLKIQKEESEKVAQALYESEEKLRTLFSSMTEMVALHELVFDENGEAVNYRIFDCNQAYTEITGIERENAVGRLATEVYQTAIPPYLKEFSTVALTGNPYEYTTYFAPMDKHFSISVVSPRKNQFATVTTDITTIRQIQEVITAKNKELENYLYVASHDLRSPLVNIQGFSQRLYKQVNSIKSLLSENQPASEIKEEISKITDEDIPKTLNYISSNAAKMDSLLTGLLQISRTGRAFMMVKQIDINNLIKTIIDSNNFQLTEIGAHVTISDLPPCYGDENLLNQLFSNIITNAIKYRNKTSPLLIEITARTEFKKVIYKVKDNGIGIEQRHIERIWDVFFRIDSASKDSGEGLGLSIVKRIVEKHNGKVWVESEPGKGSEFLIELQKNEFSL